MVLGEANEEALEIYKVWCITQTYARSSSFAREMLITDKYTVAGELWLLNGSSGKHVRGFYQANDETSQLARLSPEPQNPSPPGEVRFLSDCLRSKV